MYKSQHTVVLEYFLVLQCLANDTGTVLGSILYTEYFVKLYFSRSLSTTVYYED
jgi:hypothetical protein